MNLLKNLGQAIVRIALLTLGIVFYFLGMFLPLVVTQKETIMTLWLVIFLTATAYVAIVYKVAQEKGTERPFLERIKSSVAEATKKFFIGVGILICLLIFAVITEEMNTSYISPTLDHDKANYIPAPSTYTTPVQNYVSPTSYETPAETPTPVHYDSSYRYNYRTGYSGNYDYNYDIEGYSDNGDYFYGNVDTSDKYGEGYVYDDFGNEIYVETEWVDYGVMEATDEDGNVYEFEVD